MNKPTNAEIKDLYAQETGFILDDSPAALLDFARAVLAKWGTPQPVVQEPLTQGQIESLLWTYGYDPDDDRMVAILQAARGIAQKWGTPQPVVREPLTANQVSELANSAGYWHGDTSRADFINGIRYAEAAHGIKGGQHG